ncbi:GNAT family N-acetyltransferase [Rhodococcus sp. MEB064]|uniref:GNAT family N-acetyltransferase n=1 Tax=Rhodococcus sp. MEB064 TaxID=1587522 RepID=UPI0005ACF185|nr:GNAT family N-acetyltransferase [Rhodococcus sp. MEB064]
MHNSLVSDDPSRSRFELTVDDELVGILAYEVAPGTTTVVLQHTVVREEFGDHGWAAVLVRGALDILRIGDLTVWPVCTYVRRFIGANIEYLDLVADQDPASLSSTTTGA